MYKTVAGAVFCMMAAVLESARYIAAAVYMSGGATQSRELYVNGLAYVGIKLEVIAAAAFCAGVILMAWAAADQRRK